jgi:hypothetical protein
MTTGSGGGMSNIINLAALAVPVVPETSDMVPKLVAAGEKAGAAAGAAAGNTFNIYFRQATRKAEEESLSLGERMGKGVLQGFQRTGVGGQLQSMMGGLNLEKLGVVAGFAAAVVAVEKLGKALINIGEEFEGINRQVELMTTATGPQLDDMKEHVDNLVGSLDTSTKNLGSDFAILHQRLGLTGTDLDTVTKHVEEMRDRFGEFNSSNFAGAMLQFNVAAKDTDNTMASLVKSSRAFGVSLGTVIDGVAEAGPALRALGLNAEQAGYLMAAMAEKGLGGPAGPQMLARAEKANIETNKATGLHRTLGEFIETENAAIRALAANNDEAGAEQESFLAYGLRNWPLAIAAAEPYSDAIKKTHDQLKGSGKDIDDVADKTRTLTNEWERLSNEMHNMFRPEAKWALDWMTKMVRGMESGTGQGFWHWLTHSNEPVPDLPTPPAPGAPGGPPAVPPPSPHAGQTWTPDSSKPGGGSWVAPGTAAPAAPGPSGIPPLGGVALKDKSSPMPPGPGASQADVIKFIVASAKARGIPDNQIPGILAVAQAESQFGITGFMGFSTKTTDTGYTGGAPYANDYSKAMNQFLDNYMKGGLGTGGGEQAKAAAIDALNHGDPGPFLAWLQNGMQGAAPALNPEFAGNLRTGYSRFAGASLPVGGSSGTPAAGSAGTPVGMPGAASQFPGASGIQQVIFSNTKTGQKTGEAGPLSGGGAPGGGGQQLVGPGTANAGYYASDWEGHTGHVHTSFTKSPTTGEPYGLPANTTITQGGPGFPAWVYDLGKKYGLIASTYPGHQVLGDGLQHGIDWWPAAGGNMTGAGYTDSQEGDLQTFATGMATAGAGGGGSAPGAPAPAGMPGAPVLASSPGKQGVFPLGGRGSGGGAPSPNKVDETETHRNKALRDATDAVQDWTNAITDDKDNLKAVDGALLDAQRELLKQIPGTKGYVDAQAEVTKQEKAHRDALLKLNRDYEHLGDAQDDLREATDKMSDPIKGGGKGGSGAEQQFGAGLLSGIAQSLGLSDVFGSKAPWEFGSVKMGLGLLNWAMSGLHGGGGPLQGGRPAAGPAAGSPVGAPKPNDPGVPWGGKQANTVGYVDNSITVNTADMGFKPEDLHPIMNSYQRNQQTAAAPGGVGVTV